MISISPNTIVHQSDTSFTNNIVIMEEYYSPDQVKTFINRAKTDRQKVILYLLYNYGFSPSDVLSLKKSNFVVSRDYILLSIVRGVTQKEKRIRISSDSYYRIFYRILIKLDDDGAYLLNKDKGKQISKEAFKKDLFDVAVEVNKRITATGLFDSHLYWSYRKGLNYNQAVEEYGLNLGAKNMSLWEKAFADGRIIPRLL